MSHPGEHPVPATQTALVVTVPEAEHVVGRHRAQLDVAASWGVPAHVTVLYPFLPRHLVDPRTRAAVAAAVATVPAFGCSFVGTAWFGEDVLWLRPTPEQPFVALTRAVRDAFPDTPPYGGRHGDAVVPHLTVGERRRSSLRRLQDVEREVRAALPVRTRVDNVALLEGTDAPRSWRLVQRFPLGAAG